MNEVLEELEFEIVMCQKTGKANLIPGLERALEVIEQMIKDN